MAKLIAVNVGLPRDVAWQGRVVRTAIWKQPVAGRCRAGRLNLAGDGQGDLAGHGGEQRAVLAYQCDSYRHWERELGRHDFTSGQFGENFTIEGLPDDEVCVGDRYRIGGALFEVTQPRVTCYRVGLRMAEPRMPALLTGSGRPGFYLRVLEEGDVGAGDEIRKVGESAVRMTIARLNALLYSSQHERAELDRALAIEALSPGWRTSFAALARSADAGAGGGNAGLVPRAAAHPAAPGFRALVVAGIEQASADVVSLTLRDPAGAPLPPPLPGQYVVLRLRPDRAGPAVFRSYSLSGAATGEHYRISVKVEPNGVGGTYLQEHVRMGDTLDTSSPRGSFVIEEGDTPVVLLSAGIGVTPVLAMLHALASARSPRQVLWIHATRDGAHDPFGGETRDLLLALPHARRYVSYSAPAAGDRPGAAFDTSERLSRAVLERVGVPPGADVYLCGPPPFMADMRAALVALGVAEGHVRVERFNGGEALTPGIAASAGHSPHAPAADADRGPRVSFARSGVSAHWDAALYRNLLELAEACDVPVRWSCRAGVCHNCESGLVAGSIVYDPAPLDAAAEGNVLVCCARPVADVVLEL